MERTGHSFSRTGYGSRGDHPRSLIGSFQGSLVAHNSTQRRVRTPPRRRSQLILGAAAYLILLGAAECPWSPGSRANTRTANRTPGDSAGQVLYGVRINLTHEGLLRAALNADSSRAFNDASRHELFGVRVTFIDTSGATTGTLTSSVGTYSVQDGKFTASENVVVQHAEGERLTTTQATFDQARNLVVGDSSYQVFENEAQRDSGVGFELDPRTFSVAPRSAPSDSAGTRRPPQ